MEDITIAPFQRLLPPAGIERTPEQLGRTTTYTVEPGDTYEGIALRFYGDGERVHDIFAGNGLAGTEPLKVGQELVIPLGPEG